MTGGSRSETVFDNPLLAKGNRVLPGQFRPLMRVNALLRNNMLIAPAASCSGPERWLRVRRSAVSTLSSAPITVFGWFRWNKLVQGPTFGAIK